MAFFKRVGRMAGWTILLLAGFLHLCLCLSTPTGADAAEASGIVKAVSSQFGFPDNAGGERAFYFSPHPRHSEIAVYGKYSMAEQDRILEIARTVRREKATKPVWVVFYGIRWQNKDSIRKEIIP
ncbi:MAG: hypothetical protein EOO09_21875 [Chitinophagaceae bacterium]|nr:MAG: hypothetical protein EOO09_21875 [Chitinophagaceae bacterium]